MAESRAVNSNSPSGSAKGKWQLRAILLVSFVPVVAAYVAYYTGWGVPEGTVNNGLMIAPAVDVKPLMEKSEGDLPKLDAKPVWRFVLPLGEQCNKACENNLYVTRQVGIRLGEKSLRVARMVINFGGKNGSDYLKSIAKDHPNLNVLTVGNMAWQQWLLEGNVTPPAQEAHHYYLMDPQGFVMLRYSDSNTGNELLGDIKRILRYSPED